MGVIRVISTLRKIKNGKKLNFVQFLVEFKHLDLNLPVYSLPQGHPDDAWAGEHAETDPETDAQRFDRLGPESLLDETGWHGKQTHGGGY